VSVTSGSPCASKSYAFGSSLTVYEMTPVSTFLIVSRDSFDNVRTPLSPDQDRFASFLYFPEFGNGYYSNITLGVSNLNAIYNGTIGTPKVYVGTLRRTVLYHCSGLFATYYDTSSLTQPVSARISDSIWYVGGDESLIHSSLSSSADWSVRWSGFFRVTAF